MTDFPWKKVYCKCFIFLSIVRFDIFQEEEYHRLKEEEIERDMKTKISKAKLEISNKDEKIALMEEQLTKLTNKV